MSELKESFWCLDFAQADGCASAYIWSVYFFNVLLSIPQAFYLQLPENCTAWFSFRPTNWNSSTCLLLSGRKSLISCTLQGQRVFFGRTLGKTIQRFGPAPAPSQACSKTLDGLATATGPE